VTEYKHKGLLVLTDDGLVDVAASEARLADTLDPVRGGDRTGAKKQPAADGRLAQARVEETELRNAKLRLELDKMAGTLVDKEGVKVAGFTLAREAQEKLLAIADRLAPLLAAESDPAKVHAMMSKELRLVAQSIAKAARERLDAARKVTGEELQHVAEERQP
jgi:hypothetical protein